MVETKLSSKKKMRNTLFIAFLILICLVGCASYKFDRTKFDTIMNGNFSHMLEISDDEFVKAVSDIRCQIDAVLHHILHRNRTPKLFPTLVINQLFIGIHIVLGNELGKFASSTFPFIDIPDKNITVHFRRINLIPRVENTNCVIESRNCRLGAALRHAVLHNRKDRRSDCRQNRDNGNDRQNFHH